MRILLTDQGKNLVNILGVEYQETDRKINLTEPNKSTMKSITNPSINRSRNFQTTHNSTTRSKNESIDKNIPKPLEVKMKKLQISKNITEKYNNDTKSNNILLNLPDIIPKKLSPTNNNSANITRQALNETNDFSSYHFSIKEIISKQTYSKFKHELKRDLLIKDRNSIIDDTKFRSSFKEKNEKEVLEDKLNTKIGSEWVNIIKYLNSQSNLNYQFVQNLTDYDDQRLNKINKICQKVFENNERNELFQKIAKEKINLKKRKDIAEYKEKLETLSNYLSTANVIKNEYILPTNVRRNKFRDIHEDIRRKYWSKHSIEELSKFKGENQLHNETTSMINSSGFH